MFLKKEKGRPRSCSTTARIKVDETLLEWLNETQCVKQRVIFFPSTLQRQDGSTEPMPKDRGAEQGDVHGLLKVSLALGMFAARTRLRERFQTRRSLPAPNQFSGTLRTNQGVWITVKVLWAQHFGSVAAKLLAHVSSHHAMGDGYPYKAPQGFERSSFTQPCERLHWEKNALSEALLEQPDCEEPSADRWPGHEPVTFSTEYQLSPTQPMTLRKAASIVSGQTVQVKSPPPNVSGGTASLMNRAKQSLRTILGQIQTSTLPRKGCTKLACQAFFQSSLPLLLSLWQINHKRVKSEQPEGWYQLAPIHFHQTRRVQHQLQSSID